MRASRRSSTFDYALSTDEVVASHHGARQGAIVKREQPLSSNPCHQDFHQNSCRDDDDKEEDRCVVRMVYGTRENEEGGGEEFTIEGER